MTSDQSIPQPGLKDTELVNHVVRLVIPMRREFSVNVDVAQFLSNLVYAQGILAQAKISQDAALRERALHIESVMFGGGAPPPPPKNRDAAPPPPAPAPAKNPMEFDPNDYEEPTEAEMRARMMSKYRGGLR